MSKRAEKAIVAFHNQALSEAHEYARMHGGSLTEEVCYGRGLKVGFLQGYEQAEKDLAPAFEFSFDVPDNDGHIVFTPMDNMTIRKELKLKKGERVIVSIRKEHEKE